MKPSHESRTLMYDARYRPGRALLMSAHPGGVTPPGQQPVRRLPSPPFAVDPISTTPSIPEPMALAIRTPAGTVLHTGDWKFDSHPVLGPVSDEDRLREVGGE